MHRRAYLEKLTMEVRFQQILVTDQLLVDLIFDCDQFCGFGITNNGPKIYAEFFGHSGLVYILTFTNHNVFKAVTLIILISLDPESQSARFNVNKVKSRIVSYEIPISL